MRTDATATTASLALVAVLAASGPGFGLPAQVAPTKPAEVGPEVRIRPLTVGGRTVDWAPRGDLIAFDKLGPDGFANLYVAEPEGTLERCLTCAPLEFRKRHAGNPTWHPSGRFLVFQVEKPFKIGGAPLPFLSVPGRNLGDDLWAITPDGRRFWRLTNRGERGGRVLAPRFSREGDRLVWSERLASGAGAWGRWVLRVARFGERRNVPRLHDIQTFEPGAEPGFYESCDFTADDRGVLFAGNPAPGLPESGLDLWVLRLESGELARLTASAGELDRFARFTPDGRSIVWSSTRGLIESLPPFPRGARSAVTVSDLWRMSADGGEPQRLTRFADVFSTDYAGPVTVGAPAWSREGDRFIVPVSPASAPGAGDLYLVELASPSGAGSR